MLLLVRHSAPELDPAVPAEEWRLSDEGRRRCARLAVQVGAYEPQHLLCSPEPKALETAELIAPELDLEVVVADDLREHARRTVGWLDRSRFERGVRELFARPHEVVFGEESANDALARFAAVVDAVERPAVVVSHGTVISLYAAGTDPDGGFGFWKALGLPDVVKL